MLYSFSLAGFRSFKEPVTISFRSSQLTENQETLNDGGYLPVTALFGPNSSGKSSLLEALKGVVEFISLPLLSASIPLSLREQNGSTFTLEYSSAGNVYRYMISISGDEIAKERLEKLSGEKRSSLLFNRTENEVSYHGQVKSIGAGDVPLCVPLLTVMMSEHPDNPVISEAYRGLSECLIFPSADVNLSLPCDSRVKAMLLCMGFEEAELSRKEMSSGLASLYAFLPSFFSAIDGGKMLVCDDFLPSLHPALHRFILSLFTDRKYNRNGAAFLFSSQDITLMDISMLRRDEIWFAEKKNGVSSLSRLSDIKIRKDARLLKGYEEHEFGSWPVIGPKESKEEGSAEKREDRKLFSINNRRYLGNKFRITRFIREIADEHCQPFDSFADIFSGTGSVSYAFRDKKLILNDFLYSNYLANLAWFSPESFDKSKLERLIDEYNSMAADEENYMSDNFSDTYFSRENCRKIGAVREDIERRFRTGELNARERAVLIVSLLYAMDRIAATCGHYDAYREGADLSAVLCMRMLDADETNNCSNEIFCADANALVKRIKADVVYIDPPYNSRQYSDAYHLLENVARWEKPDVKGKAGKMDRKCIKSLYSTSKAEDAFRALIASIDAKYILLSYNNMHDKGDSRSNAKISDETILSVLSEKGEVSVYSTQHRAFSAGKSHIEDNEERVFLCAVRQKRTRKTSYIQSPLNYIGGKGRIITDLLDAFPPEIDTFVDLFAGGCTVGVNAPCRRVIFNDSDARLIALLREMRRSDKDRFIEDIKQVIKSYGLSQSDVHGYGYYHADSSKGLGDVNKAAYNKLREDYNSRSFDEHMRAVMLYVLIIYGFNNQIRFNDDGAFNLPVGKRDFNSRMQEKLSIFIDRIKELDAVFLDADFRTVQIPSGSFVYADPPYFVTTATYNERKGWTENDETSLHEILENLTARGIRFALSNTLRSRGRENTFLISWLEKHPEYRVIHVKRDYSNSNYHIKDRDAESDEVIILNY